MADASKFRITFLIRVNENTQKKVPIYVRISLNSSKTEINTRCFVDPKLWDRNRTRLSPKAKESAEVNLLLDRINKRILECYQELTLAGKQVTCHVIKQMFLGNDENQKTTDSLFEYHNKTFKSKITKGTYNHYIVTQGYFNNFISEQLKLDTIKLATIDYKLLIDFEVFLRNKKGRNPGETMDNNTVMKHFCRMRKMLNLAERLEWISKNPFKTFKLHYDYKERGFLTQHDLDAIENLELKDETSQVARDLFIFACYTGIPFSDQQNLTTDNISKGIDGNLWLSYARIKTGVPTRLPLFPKALDVIVKYRDSPWIKNQNHLMPNLTNQHTNRLLKEMAKRCGINKNLTFHMARHTFATTITLSNGVPIETVSKILGHVKIATTQIYAKVLEKKISEDMMNLLNKMQKESSQNQNSTLKLSV